MRKTREEKAITLIALIITIVVLLILAVVAINAVTGDGIIQHATNAKTEYKKAQTDEEMMLSNYETYLKGNLDTWDGESKKAPKIKDGDWYIYTCSEFKFFADFVNGRLSETEKLGKEITEDTTVYLMSNLDLGARQENGELTTGTEWTPIGTSSTISFEGTFEGNNHYIEGVYINLDRDFVGLFGYSKNGEIRNLTIKDSYIKAKWCTGGIIGRGDKITNCHNINTNITRISNASAGGIAGQARELSNCSNTGIVTDIGTNTDGDSNLGGIVGTLYYSGSIKNCTNSGNIIGIGNRIGGIVGTTAGRGGAEVNGCSNFGDIKGASATAGIVGSASQLDDKNNINLSNCYNIGKIEGAPAGGIVGTLAGAIGNGSIKGCYNIGKVTGIESIPYGIVGRTFTTTGNTIAFCYYLNGTAEKGVYDLSDAENVVEVKEESEIKTKTLADLLNTATNAGAWVGSDTEYPRLSWE